MAQAPLKAFISYKWESDSHNQWVETFAKHLRDHGINAILDRWEVRLGDSFTNYMTSKITEADVVLFIMTERSVAAAEAPEGKGGAVKFEMQLAASRRIAGEKMRLIGIYREGNKTPAHLRDHRYVDFRNDSLYSSSLQELIDDLRGVDKRPPLALHNLRAQAPMSAKRFRIAFSFAGEKRGYVAQVAAILAKRFGEAAILYDKYHEAEFSRSDLAFYLPDLYEKEADLVVVVFCPDYDKKEWCGLEWNAVFGLLKARNAREVMLTRFEGAEGTGLHRLADYTDLDDLTPKQASDIVLERLAVNEGLPKEYYKAASSDPLGEDRRPPLAIQNPRAEGARILQILCDEPLDGETLANRIGKKSWHDIQPDVAYLEGQGYVVPNPRNISGRIIYIPSITKKGRAFVENGMQPSLPKGQFLRKVDIFISSPSDVYEERQRVKRVIERCSRSPFIAPHFALRPLAYEDSVPAEVGNGPVQDVIDRHMKAGSSDLFICILWHRMGTPVTVDGERFQSGTEYEFVDAYRNKQRHGKPYMLLYRGMKPLSPEVDLQQLKAVEAFFERFKGEHAELEGNVRSYRSTDEFEDLLRQDIDHALNRL